MFVPTFNPMWFQIMANSARGDDDSSAAFPDSPEQIEKRRNFVSAYVKAPNLFLKFMGSQAGE